MASFAKKFNRERVFDVDTQGFEYYSLEELYEEFGGSQTYLIKGMYVNTKSLYGEAITIALDDRYVNVPSNLTAVCKEMLADKQTISCIQQGHAGFTIYPYSAHGKTCYGVTWVDIP